MRRKSKVKKSVGQQFVYVLKAQISEGVSAAAVAIMIRTG